MQLLDHLRFQEMNPVADPLFVDKEGRILRFCLRPGQSIIEHEVPHSPFYVVVLQGHGIFTYGGQEMRAGPYALLVFDPGEKHSVRALDEEFVFVGFLHGAPGTREGRTGGELGRTA
jgi:quercetin dioxygenase-like cupin family protein